MVDYMLDKVSEALEVLWILVGSGSNHDRCTALGCLGGLSGEGNPRSSVPMRTWSSTVDWGSWWRVQVGKGLCETSSGLT
jgi:hypothetical protein